MNWLVYLFPVVGALMWAWRGSQYTWGNFLTAVATSFIMIGAYVKVMNIPMTTTVVIAMVLLAFAEMTLGYGKSFEAIDLAHSQNNLVEAKEDFTYVGLITMLYTILPFMYLYPNKPNWVYLVVGLIGATIFPLAKYLQLVLYNGLVIKYKLDPWKLVEAQVGLEIILVWLIGGKL